MSSNRRVNVELTGTSRGLEAALNRIDQGLGRTTQRVRQTNREMSLWERQIMAIGTTARYAFAGQFVFGITAALSRLGDFTNRLGQVASLAGTLNRGTGNYTGPGQGFLSGVGDAAILESNKVGVAVDDIQQYMTRFFSTFQVPAGNRMSEMRGFVDEVARLAAMLGTEAGDPQQLAGGIASMVNQIPGGRRNIAGTTNRVANLISFMLAETPNVTGRDISRDIGRIGATQQMANMTPEQVFAVWGLAGKAGGSSAVIGRGIAQLLGSSLMHPQTPGQVKAYQSIGLPADPNMLARMGGMHVLMRIMERAGGNMRIRNRGALTDEGLDDESALAAAGVSGVNRSLLYNLFGRQESVRQFIALMGQGGVKALKDYIEVQNRATRANAVRQREDEFQRQNALTRFNVQRQTLSLGLARGIRWPLEHIVAPPVGALSDVVTEHNNATQVALGALFGGLAVRRGRRLLNAWRNRGANASPGTALVETALQTESMPNVLAGGPTDGTRSNPFWVIIHPDSWIVGAPPGGGPLGGGGGTTVVGAPGAGMKGKGKIPSLGRIGGKVIGAGTAYLFASELTNERYNGRAGWGNLAHDIGGAIGKIGGVFGDGEHGNRAMNFRGRITKEDSLVDLMHRAMPNNNTLATVIGTNLERFSSKEHFVPVVVEVTGNAKQDFTIRLVDEQGRALKVEQKKGLPTRFQMAKPAPQYRGKQRAQTKSTGSGGNLSPYMVP